MGARAKHRRFCLRRRQRRINFTVHENGALRTALSVGPRSGSSGAGSAFQNGGKNGTAVPGHHCHQHVHAGHDGTDFSVYVKRPSQLLAVSSLSSGGMSAAHIETNGMTPATSTMAPSSICFARSSSVSSYSQSFSAEALLRTVHELAERITELDDLRRRVRQAEATARARQWHISSTLPRRGALRRTAAPDRSSPLR